MTLSTYSICQPGLCVFVCVFVYRSANYTNWLTLNCCWTPSRVNSSVQLLSQPENCFLSPQSVCLVPFLHSFAVNTLKGNNPFMAYCCLVGQVLRSQKRIIFLWLNTIPSGMNASSMPVVTFTRCSSTFHSCRRFSNTPLEIDGLLDVFGAGKKVSGVGCLVLGIMNVPDLFKCLSVFSACLCWPPVGSNPPSQSKVKHFRVNWWVGLSHWTNVSS